MTINYSPNQTVTSPQPIDVTVTATASDGKGGQASQSQTIAFIGNRSPTIDSFTHSPSGNYFPVGTQINFLATASDPDDDIVTLSYTPNDTITLSAPGAVTVTVAANDGNGGEVSQSATVNGFEVEIYETNTPSPETSFISADQLSFLARVNGVSGYNNQIDWIGTDNPGGIDSGDLDPGVVTNSAQYTASPNPPTFPGCPDGRDGVLSYKIFAFVAVDGASDADTITIIQDEIDQCRQEYTSDDFNQATVPGRSAFTNSGGSTHFSFAEANWGDYSWAIFNIYNNLESVRSNYGYGMQVNSGYRNPVHNRCAVGGVVESRHIYGLAADIQVFDHAGDGSRVDDWWELHDAAVAAGASVESITQGGVGHVHMQW